MLSTTSAVEQNGTKEQIVYFRILINTCTANSAAAESSWTLAVNLLLLLNCKILKLKQ
jgi:hypothetical protein